MVRGSVPRSQRLLIITNHLKEVVDCPSSTGTACSYSCRITVRSQHQPGACSVVTPMAMHGARGSACRQIK